MGGPELFPVQSDAMRWMPWAIAVAAIAVTVIAVLMMSLLGDCSLSLSLKPSLTHFTLTLTLIHPLTHSPTHSMTFNMHVHNAVRFIVPTLKFCTIVRPFVRLTSAGHDSHHRIKPQRPPTPSVVTRVRAMMCKNPWFPSPALPLPPSGSPPIPPVHLRSGAWPPTWLPNSPFCH